MRLFMMVLALMTIGAAPAMADVANGEAMAYRMNRDGDYPWDPSDRQYLVMPKRDEIQRYNREMIRYEMSRKAQAKAEWVAMTPDEKRRFLRNYPQAFQRGGILRDF